MPLSDDDEEENSQEPLILVHKQFQYALKQWNIFARRCAQQKSSRRIATNELKVKDILSRCSSHSDLLDGFKFWRIFAFIRRRKKRVIFTNLFRKQYLLRKLYRQNRTVAVFSFRAPRHLAWRRWQRWVFVRRHLAYLCRQRAVDINPLSPVKAIRRRLKALQRLVVEKARQQHIYTRALLHHIHFQTHSVLHKLQGHQHDHRRVKTIHHIASIFAQRRKLYFAMDLLISRHSQRQHCCSLIQEAAHRKKTLAMHTMVRRFRRLKQRSGLVCNRLRNNLQTTPSPGFGETCYQQFDNDTSFFLYGRPLAINTYQRATLLVGCLSQFSRRTNVWSCGALVCVRWLLEWRRRLLVQVNRRIRCTQGAACFLRRQWRSWRVCQLRMRLQSHALSERAWRYYTCRWWQRWTLFRAMSTGLHTSGRRGGCHWKQAVCSKAIKQWREGTVRTIERNNIAIFIAKRKAMHCFLHFMQLRKFRILISRAALRWSYRHIQTSFRFWRKVARVRCRVRRFMRVQQCYKAIVKEEAQAVTVIGSQLQSVQALAAVDTNLLWTCWAAWKERWLSWNQREVILAFASEEHLSSSGYDSDHKNFSGNDRNSVICSADMHIGSERASKYEGNQLSETTYHSHHSPEHHPPEPRSTSTAFTATSEYGPGPGSGSLSGSESGWNEWNLFVLAGYTSPFPLPNTPTLPCPHPHPHSPSLLNAHCHSDLLPESESESESEMALDSASRRPYFANFEEEEDIGGPTGGNHDRDCVDDIDDNYSDIISDSDGGYDAIGNDDDFDDNDGCDDGYDDDCDKGSNRDRERKKENWKDEGVRDQHARGRGGGGRGGGGGGRGRGGGGRGRGGGVVVARSVFSTSSPESSPLSAVPPLSFPLRHLLLAISASFVP